MSRREWVAGWAQYVSCWYVKWRQEHDALMAEFKRGLLSRKDFEAMLKDEG